MEKLFVCYLMNNILDDISDTRQNMNLSLSEKKMDFIDKQS